MASEENEVFRDDEESGRIKESIAKALMEHNPRLTRFEFDHNKIAEMHKISIEDAKKR